MSALSDLFYSALYNSSYYLIYFYKYIKNKVVNVGRYFNDNVVPIWEKDNYDDIHVSHIYFRPTSPARYEEASYNVKYLLPLSLEKVKEREDFSHLWDMITKPVIHYHKKYNEKIKCLVGDTLEIHYTVPFKTSAGTTFRKSYIVPYTYPAKIHFPPYDLDYIHENTGDIYLPTILSAEIDNRDITNEVERWAGPLGNFYTDKRFKEGVQVTYNHIVGDDDNKLVITNDIGDDFEFKNNSVITLEKEEKINQNIMIKDLYSDSSNDDEIPELISDSDSDDIMNKSFIGNEFMDEPEMSI